MSKFTCIKLQGETVQSNGERYVFWENCIPMALIWKLHKLMRIKQWTITSTILWKKGNCHTKFTHDSPNCFLHPKKNLPHRSQIIQKNTYDQTIIFFQYSPPTISATEPINLSPRPKIQRPNIQNIHTCSDRPCIIPYNNIKFTQRSYMYNIHGQIHTNIHTYMHTCINPYIHYILFALPGIALCYTPFHSIPLQSAALHCITLHHIHYMH